MNEWNRKSTITFIQSHVSGHLTKMSPIFSLFLLRFWAPLTHCHLVQRTFCALFRKLKPRADDVFFFSPHFKSNIMNLKPDIFSHREENQHKPHAPRFMSRFRTWIHIDFWLFLLFTVCSVFCFDMQSTLQFAVSFCSFATQSNPPAFSLEGLRVLFSLQNSLCNQLPWFCEKLPAVGTVAAENLSQSDSLSLQSFKAVCSSDGWELKGKSIEITA